MELYTIAIKFDPQVIIGLTRGFCCQSSIVTQLTQLSWLLTINSTFYFQINVFKHTCMVGRFDLARGRLVERDQEHDSDGGRVKVPQVGWEVNTKYERQVGVVQTNRKTVDKHYLYLRDGGGAVISKISDLTRKILLRSSLSLQWKLLLGLANICLRYR